MPRDVDVPCSPYSHGHPSRLSRDLREILRGAEHACRPRRGTSHSCVWHSGRSCAQYDEERRTPDDAATSSYLVDNRGLQSKSRGLVFRQSTCLWDKARGSGSHVARAAWGDVVHGQPQGRGLGPSGELPYPLLAQDRTDLGRQRTLQMTSRVGMNMCVCLRN